MNSTKSRKAPDVKIFSEQFSFAIENIINLEYVFTFERDHHKGPKCNNIIIFS